jgi:hypothetical protein
MMSLWRILMLIAPARYADWIAGMLIEADTLPRPARFLWRASSVFVATGMRVRESELQVHAGCLAVTMILIDWVWGAFVPALFMIGLSATVLTRRSREARVTAFVVVAGTLPLAHSLANWVPALWPHYQYAPLDGRDWLILVLVAGIGVCSVRLAEAVRAITS